MIETDALGRATFHSIAPRTDVVPTERDIRWFKHIERHGPLTSAHLIEVTSDTHRCKDTGLKRLQALRAGGYLFLPKQQRRCEKADFRPYVYDLAAKGLQHLSETGLRENTVRPTGHWWHLHETAMFTAQVDLEARQRGFRYIPAHEILERAGASLAIPMGRRKLIPDQLFAIDYRGLFRAFMVEVDRGTEPIVSVSARKSWKSALLQYSHGFSRGLPNQHYTLKAPIQVIWVFSTKRRARAFGELVRTVPRHLSIRHLSSVAADGVNCNAIWKH